MIDYFIHVNSREPLQTKRGGFQNVGEKHSPCDWLENLLRQDIFLLF